ncbi:MAG: hypothetical protein NW216_04475 [Hyphomicrobium sp.]|nr:hypothetical protein [Hyphomicrobium sp.]
MAQETADATPPSAELVAQIAELLARPPTVTGIELDTDYFAGSDGRASQSSHQRVLLPNDYAWRPLGSGVPPRVPLQLCEYLAYKTALAYEPTERIKAFLEKCCSGVTHYRFFDSTTNKADAAGVLADAQGFGYVFERKAFLIFRGTTSGSDWTINRIDALTSDLVKPSDRRAKSLRKEYGRLIDKLGDPNPGRHVGFSIAWAALKDDVEDWLAGLLEHGAIDKIIYAGHSLGGAMAQVAAFDHARIETGFERDRGIAPSRVGAVVTFGAPAVGGPAFSAEYKKLLGDRTVLLESSGDLVPRIMNRWYYQMLYPVRQRVKAGVQAHLVSSEGFAKVSPPWVFASEPPMSDQDIDNAVAGLRETAAKTVAALAEQKKQQDAAEAAKKAAADPKNGAAAQATPPKAQSPKNEPPKAEPAPTWLYWVLIGVVVVAAGGVVWYFVRRKLYSHDIEERYALYLSTLSYQQLRAKHCGNLQLADKELDEHLKFVRGDLASSHEIAKAIPAVDGSSTAFFEAVQKLPLPIKVRNDPAFVEYLKRNETFV